MNLGELRAEVNRRTGVAYDATALNGLVNEALMKLSLAEDWPWLEDVYTFSATTDIGEEVLPEGVRRVLGVTIDGFEGHPTVAGEIDAWDNEYADRRTGFFISGSTMLFRPTQTTGTEVTVRFLADEPRLEDDGDEPLLPDAYHEAIIEHVGALVLERQSAAPNALARADRMMARYESLVRDMKRKALRAGRRTGRVRVRPGGI